MKPHTELSAAMERLNQHAKDLVVDMKVAKFMGDARRARINRERIDDIRLVLAALRQRAREREA